MDAITGATALLGESLTPVPDAVVLLSDGRIAGAGPSSSVEIPAQAAVFDASGMTLVPGFIDCHVHIGFYEPRTLLVGGVTTARDTRLASGADLAPGQELPYAQKRTPVAGGGTDADRA